MKLGLPASVMPWVHGVTQHPVGKRGFWAARRATVEILGIARRIEWLRKTLRLPSNLIVDPMHVTSGSGMRVTKLVPPRYFRRALPKLPEDGPALKYFAARSREYSETQYVAVLDRGSIWGSAHGAVFTRNEEFVPALSRDPWGPLLHQVWTKPRLPRMERIAGRALYLVTAEASDNYHHWMIDLLPRIGIAERAGFSIGSFDWIIVNHADRPYQWETLKKLGVGASKVLQISPAQRIQADELVVPSLKQNNEQLPAEHVRFLRDRFLPSGDRARRRRIFLSRRDARSRRLVNEEQILGLFQQFGFEEVFTSALTVEQQAELFAQAEFIAGPSGAAFANLVFASPGAAVIELAAPNWLTVYHWMISARRGLHHTVVLSEGGPPPNTLNIAGRASDFEIDLQKVARALANIPVSNLGQKPESKPASFPSLNRVRTVEAG